MKTKIKEVDINEYGHTSCYNTGKVALQETTQDTAFPVQTKREGLLVKSFRQSVLEVDNSTWLVLGKIKM